MYSTVGADILKETLDNIKLTLFSQTKHLCDHSRTINSPVAGASYKKGSVLKIIWSAQAGGGTGEAAIYLKEGTPEAPLPFSLSITPDIDLAAGSFDWSVPKNIPSARDYFIEIGVPGDLDYSGKFTIA